MFPRVLVVDDSAFMRSRILRKLREAGLEVVGEARTGSEAIELYNRLLPDVVTMDLTMRDTDGLAASRSILRANPRAKIVLFSVVDDESVRAEAREAGVAACVHKSDSEELVRRLIEMTSRGDERAN
jgi:two-component system chemotaxis response regulator CheY